MLRHLLRAKAKYTYGRSQLLSCVPNTHSSTKVVESDDGLRDLLLPNSIQKDCTLDLELHWRVGNLESIVLLAFEAHHAGPFVEVNSVGYCDGGLLADALELQCKSARLLQK